MLNVDLLGVLVAVEEGVDVVTAGTVRVAALARLDVDPLMFGRRRAGKFKVG